MNILIVANHYAVCSARYAADAFTRLGHTVRHVGPAMGRNIWGIQVPEEYVWTPDARSNKYSGYPTCDLTIIMDSDPAVLDDQCLGARSYVDAARVFDKNAPIIVWGVDNHVRDYRRPYFDHYFLAHKSVSVMEWEFHEPLHNPSMAAAVSDVAWPEGARSDMTWLPCCYDATAFPPSPIAWADRAYDACMIGVLYPKRWELVQAMRVAGLKVFAGTGLVYDAYRDAYWNSRVALVSSFNGDLPIRFFEGIGMGCMVISDPIADFAYLDQIRSKKHENGIQHYVYKSVEQAVELASTLQKIDERDRYINPEALADHTWDARCQVILNWVEARS